MITRKRYYGSLVSPNPLYHFKHIESIISGIKDCNGKSLFLEKVKNQKGELVQKPRWFSHYVNPEAIEHQKMIPYVYLSSKSTHKDVQTIEDMEIITTKEDKQFYQHNIYEMRFYSYKLRMIIHADKLDLFYPSSKQRSNGFKPIYDQFFDRMVENERVKLENGLIFHCIYDNHDQFQPIETNVMNENISQWELSFFIKDYVWDRVQLTSCGDLDIKEFEYYKQNNINKKKNNKKEEGEIYVK